MTRPLEAELRGWFDRVGTADIYYPDGWHGNPYDGQYALTWIASRPNWLLLELENSSLLVFSGPVTFESDTHSFELENFIEAVELVTDSSSGRQYAARYQKGKFIFKVDPLVLAGTDNS